MAGSDPNAEPVYVDLAIPLAPRDDEGYEPAEDAYGDDGDPAPYQPAQHKGVSLASPNPFGM
jgi:hypothetical protein